MELTVYLAGQIHDDWRSEVRKKAAERGLPVTFTGPQENHGLSDDIGEKIKGEQADPIRKDEAASEINNLRTRVLLNKSDVVIACFGEKYRQWNAALDVGLALQMDKPVILVRQEKLHHALKEMADRAQVVVEDIDQALEAVAYILE